MHENQRQNYQFISRCSVLAGVVFCIAGGAIALVFMDGNQLGLKLGFGLVASNAFPTLIGGFLLIMAGLILHAVTILSNE